MLGKRKDLIIKLGQAFERKVSDSESICEEIKNALREEIAQGLVSTRIIELHCPDKWKKKTKPKKVEKNENFSFSRQEQEAIPQLLVDTHGNTVVEPASDSNNNNAVNTEGSANEEVKYTENFHADNELEDVVRKSNSLINTDQQLSEQSKIRELETKIERLQLEVTSKSAENSMLQTQLKDLKSKLMSSSQKEVNQNMRKFFDVQFQVSFEDLRHHMSSSYSRNKGVSIVLFAAKVDLINEEITEVRIVDAENLKSAN
jgi:chaperonin cofactor prefoldin